MQLWLRPLCAGEKKKMSLIMQEPSPLQLSVPSLFEPKVSTAQPTKIIIVIIVITIVTTPPPLPTTTTAEDFG